MPTHLPCTGTGVREHLKREGVCNTKSKRVCIYLRLIWGAVREIPGYGPTSTPHPWTHEHTRTHTLLCHLRQHWRHITTKNRLVHAQVLLFFSDTPPTAQHNEFPPKKPNRHIHRHKSLFNRDSITQCCLLPQSQLLTSCSKLWD